MTRFLLLSLLALAACSDPSDVEPDAVPSDIAEQVADEASSALERIDLDGVTVGTDLGVPIETITTRDGAMELGLTDAVLFARLSEATQKQVAQEMDREVEDSEGLGGQIARAVTGAIEAGLGTAAQIPLDEIAAIRVEDGRIMIEMVDGEPSPFESSKTNDRPLLESFEAEDAQRLADAFSNR